MVRLSVALSSALGEGARVRVERSGESRFPGDEESPGSLALASLSVVVVWPGGVDDISRTVALAGQEGLGVTARGGASWQPGRLLPPSVGVVLDFSGFDAIEDLDFDRRLLWVQGGASWGAIAGFLEHLGLALATVPSSRFSTVAGWVSTGGFGLQSTRYGHLSRWVEALDVISPARGCERVGRDHEDFPLFFGTAGQLGLVGRVCLRVVPRVSAPHPHLLYFPSPHEAVELARMLLAEGTTPLHMKLMLADLVDGPVTGGAEPTAAEAPPPDSLLVVTDEAAEVAFQEVLSRYPACTEAQARFSHGAWQERYNPLRMQTMGLTAVSVGLVLPPRALGDFARRAVTLVRRLGLRLPMEGTYARVGDAYLVLVIATFDGHRGTATGYGASEAVVEALQRLATSLGGAAYGPNLGALHFDLEEQAGQTWLHEARARFDPHGILSSEEPSGTSPAGTPCPACGSVERNLVLVAEVAPHRMASRLLRGDPIPCKSSAGGCRGCQEAAEIEFARRAVLAVLEEDAG